MIRYLNPNAEDTAQDAAIAAEASTRATADTAEATARDAAIAAAVAGQGVFGSGIDGDVTIAADTQLTADKYYNNLTVNAGKVLSANGFRIFVKGTATIHGKIVAYLDAELDAVADAGGTGGANIGTMVPNERGGSGGAGAGDLGVSSAASMIGGNGGAGGAGAATLGGDASAGLPPAEQVGGAHLFDSLIGCFRTQSLDASNVGAGGSGGGGGGAGGHEGGGGGASGGYLWIAAKTLTGDGTLSARGGNGAAGTATDCGGGGGGGGGVMITISRNDVTASSLTLTVAAGAVGASGGGAGVAGSAGAAGRKIHLRS